MQQDNTNRGVLFSEAALNLGEIHWTILKSEKAMDARRWRKISTGRFYTREDTDFGKEIGMDEIHWWIFEKETDADELLRRSQQALGGAQSLKTASLKLKAAEPKSYQELLASLRDFADQHGKEIKALHHYVMWLAKRNPMAPRILFTYRVWGSTQMADRRFDVENENSARADMEKLRAITEIVLGVRNSGWNVYEMTRAELEYEAFERMDPENPAEIRVPETSVMRRTAHQVHDNCVTYFTELRDSLRNIVIDIRKMTDQRALFQSDHFWAEFITKSIKVKTAEPQLWDFKESLTLWHVKADEERRKAKVKFAEDIASFANTSGGVLIVGVTDERKLVGIGQGKELENRLKFARDALAAHIHHDHEVASFRQVVLEQEGASQVICLVIVISQACLPVAVSDGIGRFSYPVRRETGITLVSREDIALLDLYLKSDNRDFMVSLKQFVRDN